MARDDRKDDIYRDREDGGRFEFNERVAAVFPDMLRRSIPGYQRSLETITGLAARYVRRGTCCYDLGCSLGAATLAMRAGINAKGCRIVAVDNAPAMIARCREALAAADAGPHATPVDLLQGDLRDLPIENASMVVMNYTLQFLPLAERDALLARIAAGLVPGGILVLSEKVVAEEADVEQLLAGLHQDFKRNNAYSDLEISRKRAALENVLVPETEAAHLARLAQAGFARGVVLLRQYNFLTLAGLR